MSPENPSSIQSEETVPLRVWGWIVILVILANFIIPLIWEKTEKKIVPENARLPYHLSKDYWLYKSLIEGSRSTTQRIPVSVIGDSVVWGEYVDRDATLSAFMNEHSTGQSSFKFINAGINGLYPVVLKGLMEGYYPHNRNLPVILHVNLLWMSNREADLQDSKERTLNHTSLLPQLFQQIPPYKASLEQRLEIKMSQQIPLSRLAQHIQAAYFNNQSIPNWTMELGSSWPPDYPNANKNFLNQINYKNLEEEENDPDRGRASARHTSWILKGMTEQPDRWVDPESSIQYSAILELTKNLKRRSSSLFVVVGPLNKHMMEPVAAEKCTEMENLVSDWLDKKGISHLVLPTLPSEMYADSSHPLSLGYDQMARVLMSSAPFSKWLSELEIENP